MQASRTDRAGLADATGSRAFLGGGTLPYELIRRAIDLVVASMLVILLLPLYPIIALAIALDSRGPVIFRQQRVGRDGRLFWLLKFRSMIANADPVLHQKYVRHLLSVSSSPRPQESRQLYKVVRDPRVTRVGRVLRTTSIDELPQLINVLKGEMTLVGPRPDLPYAVEDYEPWQRKRLLVVPGITGLWQVSGRSRLSPREMMALDVRYVEQRSTKLDLMILLKTIPLVLRMRDSS